MYGRVGKGVDLVSASVAPGVQAKTNLYHIPKPVLGVERPSDPTLVFAEDGRTAVPAWEQQEVAIPKSDLY